MRILFALIAKLINIYSLLLWARIILTWFNGSRIPGSTLYDISNLLGKITDPFLNIFKRSKLTTGRIDFSPLLAFMVLNFGKSLFNILSQTGTVSIGLVIALILQNLWTYLFSYVLLSIVIMLVIRLIASSNPNAVIIQFLDPILNGPVCLVWKLFYGKKNPNEKTLVITSLVFYLVLYLLCKNGLKYLVTSLARV